MAACEFSLIEFVRFVALGGRQTGWNELSRSSFGLVVVEDSKCKDQW